MQALAPGVWLLPALPPAAINTYLLGDVLVDAGIRWTYPTLAWQLRGRSLRAHVLTHAHPDHQGASHRLCRRRALPLLCGADDAAAMAAGTTVDLLPPSPVNRLLHRLFAGPRHPVARVLREGDAVAGFRVLATPGHTPGHLSLWRAADGVLIVGDVLANADPLTQRPGLREPNPRFTLDIARNRQSARRLAALRPSLACFGHGPPLRDPEQIARFVAQLPG